MTKKLKKTATESFSISEDIEKLYHILPERFVEEIKKFEKENAIPVDHIKACCPRCLKAFIIKKSPEYNLDTSISNTLSGEPGHHGFFLNKNKLVRI